LRQHFYPGLSLICRGRHPDLLTLALAAHPDPLAGQVRILRLDLELEAMPLAGLVFDEVVPPFRPVLRI